MAVLGMKVRVACSSLIYRKSLKLKKATLQSVTTGQVINLLSNDVNRLDFAFMYIHFIWISPVEIVVGALYIDYTLGHPALIGIGLILANFVFQSTSATSWYFQIAKLVFQCTYRRD
jgi:ATP-binding cassette subfamily C (CFTR/MRP) protein 4